MKVLAAESETLARSEKSRTITAEHVKSAKKVRNVPVVFLLFFGKKGRHSLVYLTLAV